jgi:hypothetical protein
MAIVFHLHRPNLICKARIKLMFIMSGVDVNIYCINLPNSRELCAMSAAQSCLCNFYSFWMDDSVISCQCWTSHWITTFIYPILFLSPEPQKSSGLVELLKENLVRMHFTCIHVTIYFGYINCLN